MFDFTSILSGTADLITAAQSVVDITTFWGGSIAAAVGLMLIFTAASRLKRLVMRR